MDSNHELQAIEFFREFKILKHPSSIPCMKCEENSLYETPAKDTIDGFQLRCRNCTSRYSIRIGSIFFRSKIKLCILYEILYHFANKKSINEVAQALEISCHSVSRYFNYLRSIMKCYIDSRNETYKLGYEWIVEKLKSKKEAKVEDITKIDGEYFVNSGAVEVDESLIGHYRDGVTITERQVWIIGFWDRALNEGRAYVLPDRSMETLDFFITGNVEINEYNPVRIYTDLWEGYSNLGNLGYNHYRVNHSIGFGFGTYTTNHIESYFSQLKSFGNFNSGFNSTSIAAVDLQLRECEFRILFKKSDLGKVLIELMARYEISFSDFDI